MAENKRKRMVEDAIQRELGKVLISHPRRSLFTQITITAVDVAPDLTTAKVFFSVFDNKDAQEAKKMLDEENKFLRKSLAHGLNLRITPKLNFLYDKSLERSRKLSDLIDSAIAKDEQGHQE